MRAEVQELIGMIPITNMDREHKLKAIVARVEALMLPEDARERIEIAAREIVEEWEWTPSETTSAVSDITNNILAALTTNPAAESAQGDEGRG